MRIDVRANGVELSPNLREYAADRVRAALAHAAGRVVAVLVVVVDQNGPKGGDDKVCRVAVSVAGRRVVVLEHSAPQVGAAVEGAARRIGPALDRFLDRLNEGRRRERLEFQVNQVMSLFGRGVRS